MHRGVLAAVGLLILCVSAAVSRSHGSKARSGTPGVFDYYVLSLSWSPQHCFEKSDDSNECNGSRPFGFVVHGLWPQYNRGYPSGCSGPAFDKSQVPEHLIDWMPSWQLIRHEWQTHGTCSGLEQSSYFVLVIRARKAVRIPAQYTQLLRQIEVTPGQIRAAFAQANPGGDPSSFAVIDDGRFLREVHACLNKDLAMQSCTSPGDRDDDRGIVMRPVR